MMQAQAMSFTFTVTFEDGGEEFDGLKLNQFGMHEVVDDVAFFVLRPPHPAAYRLVIYARDSDLDVIDHFYL